MKLKKLLSLAAISVLAFTVLTGCSNAQSKKEDSSSKKEIIRVGSDQTTVPFTYIDDNGNHVGFEVDVWTEIGKRLGKEIKFEMGQFASLFGMLGSDNIDTVANYITVTNERKEKYDFSDTYCYGNLGLLVSPDRKDINKIEDLEGKKIGVINGSEAVTMLENLNKEKNMNFEVIVYDDDDILYPALKA